MALDKPNPDTLADVLSMLTDGTHEDTKRNRTRISAIHRIAEFLHRPPTDLPADVQSLRRLLEGLHPVQCGVSPKSLSNIKSGLADALRVTGALPDEDRGCDRTAAWEAFLDNAVADHQRWGISRFVDYCCARRIAPKDVTQEIFDRFREYLDTRLLTRSPAEHCKAAATTWNHLIKRNALPLSPLGWGRRKSYKARPLSDYPRSLRDEIDVYLKRLAHADIFEEAGPDRPLRPTSLRNIKAHLGQYLDALVQAGAAPESLTSLPVAISHDQIKVAFHAIMARRGTNSVPPGFANIAATLVAIARHHLKLPKSELDKLLAIKRRVATNPRGMSDKNAERLAQFNDWQNVVRLVSLALVLMDRANAMPVGPKSALAAMHAAALAILLSCPMRAKNLASLDLERHLRPRLKGTHTIYGIRIEGTEVKNGEPIEVVLNPKMSRLVHRYITHFRPQISDVKGTALFPRRSDGRPRSPDHLSCELSNMIRRETGLIVHVHLFRHFAAMLYLKERPGDFETVRRLLKHRRLQTTMDFYASLSNQWAHEHYDEVVLSKFGGDDA